MTDPNIETVSDRYRPRDHGPVRIINQTPTAAHARMARMVVDSDTGIDRTELLRVSLFPTWVTPLGVGASCIAR